MPQKQDNVFHVQVLYAGMRKICVILLKLHLSWDVANDFEPVKLSLQGYSCDIYACIVQAPRQHPGRRLLQLRVEYFYSSNGGM